MNKEIKEILDNIKNKYEDYYVQDIVSGNNLKQLLDYITNLQQENEQLKEKIKDADEFCDRYMAVKLELFDMYELLNKIREILGDKEWINIKMNT